MTRTSSEPGFCLVAAAESGAPWRDRVQAALMATGARTLILAPPQDGPTDPAVARPLVEMAQQSAVAVLISDDVTLARAVGADGVHLSWRPEIEDAYEAARAALGPDAIVGADAGVSRHDAMTMGEAGADYIAFGRISDATYGPDTARDAQRELVAWWANVFVVPVVAFDAETASDVEDLVHLGADFIAVRLPPARTAEQDDAWASALSAALHAPAETPT